MIICRYHSNNSISEIGQNTEKSRGDLRGLSINQTPVEDHRLTLLWKILKGVIIIIMGLLILIRWPDLVIVNRTKEKKEKKERKPALSAGTVKSTTLLSLLTQWNSNKMKIKYLDLARKQNKKQKNIEVPVIPIVIGALGTISQWFGKGLEDIKLLVKHRPFRQQQC